MATSYNIGFIQKPELAGLDAFMKSMGFEVEAPDQRIVRVYVRNPEDSASQKVEFFYRGGAQDNDHYFDERERKIRAYGNLKTFESHFRYPGFEERAQMIEEKGVRTQYDFYKHLSPERLAFYETALAFKDRYGALVVSGQTGEEINPEKPYP